MTFFGKSCFGNANKDMPSVTLEVADGKNCSGHTKESNNIFKIRAYLGGAR